MKERKSAYKPVAHFCQCSGRSYAKVTAKDVLRQPKATSIKMKTGPLPFDLENSPKVCHNLIPLFGTRLNVGEFIWIVTPPSLANLNNINSPNSGQTDPKFATIICDTTNIQSHLPKAWGVDW